MIPLDSWFPLDRFMISLSGCDSDLLHLPDLDTSKNKICVWFNLQNPEQYTFWENWIRKHNCIIYED